MNINWIWQNVNWTQEARNLLNGLAKFPKDSKIILILRHSHREDSDDPWKVSELKLTPLGYNIAKKFGENLPKERTIRLFYSFLERCRETAQGILDGFEKVLGNGILMHNLDALVDIGMKAEIFFEEITKYSFTEFFHRWVSGLYSAEIITPFNEYCQNAASIIWKDLGNTSDKGIDIHISHDLIILSYRLGWFGLRPNNYWPSFLGGFAFTINKNKILLLDYDGLKSIEVPYWWRK